MLKFPIQKLCTVPSIKSDGRLLLAASGPTITCISFDDGKPLYQWPSQHSDRDDEDDEGQENGDRPSKRRKLGQNGHAILSRQQSEASDASIEIVAERKKGERKKSKLIDTNVKPPNVSHLLTTSDGRYAIAATVEDKCITVFEIGSTGKLKVLSRRCLSKKLCALQLTKDNKTILAADKFGDVYAVPLHQSEDWKPKIKLQQDETFKPAATELTVHTKGNLHALRQQQELKHQITKKEGPDFEHQLLLGHVSLLTDLAVAEGLVNGKSRPFILTSDRDEHIRVSRGIPQSHVIENFCLGHQEFVTKLCIPPSNPDLLIAGNGEVSLKLYHWQQGTLQRSIILSPFIQNSLNDQKHTRELPEGRGLEKLAVSGIWPVEFARMTDSDIMRKSLILVAFEGIPLLRQYIVSTDAIVESGQIELKGNVLDVAVLDSDEQILVSIDNVHKPYSMKSYCEGTNPEEVSLQLFRLHTSDTPAAGSKKFSWEALDLPFDMSGVLSSLPEAPSHTAEEKIKNRGYDKSYSVLGEFLYGLEHLRKRRNLTAEEEAMEGDEEDIPRTEQAADA